MNKIDNLLMDSCQYLYNKSLRGSKDDEIISSEQLKQCENMFQNVTTLSESVQENIIESSKNNLDDPLNGFYEQCKTQTSPEAKNACLGAVLNDETSELEFKLFGNSRENEVLENQKNYNQIKKNINDTLKRVQKLNNTYTNLPETDNIQRKNAKDQLEQEIKVLYNDHQALNNEVSTYVNKIMNSYGSLENKQYNDLLTNYKLIEVNENIKKDLLQKINYIKEKNEINTKAYYNKKGTFYLLIIIIGILICIIPILLFIYFKK